MKKKLITVFICMILAALIPAGIIYAAGPGSGSGSSLTISYILEGEPMAGSNFKIYKIADVDEEGEYTVVDAFSSYNVVFAPGDQAGWQATALALYGYARRDGIEPVTDGDTNGFGVLKVDNIGRGIYLVAGGDSEFGGYVYESEPFIVSIPRRSGNNLQYDVTVNPKVRRDRPVDKEIKVIKVWKDDGREADRPGMIEVQLLGDGEVHETVRLDADNSWRYTWTGLDGTKEWLVVEKKAPEGYTVSVKREGTTVFITNTKESPEEPPETLPQTGQLWWPVFLLGGAGLVLLLTGFVGTLRRRKGNS